MEKIEKLKDCINKNCECLFLITSSEIKSGKTGPYLAVKFADETGEVEGVLWNATNITAKDYPSGMFVKAYGLVGMYKEKLQFKIATMERADVSPEVMEKFIPKAPFKSEDMYAELYETAKNFKNEELRNIVLTVLKEKKDALMVWPGAKNNHHDYIGGLLHHEMTMLRVAKSIAPIYPWLNEELLYAGVILHDIGKIQEFQLNNIGLVEQYSPMGNLQGHLFLGAEYVGAVCAKVNASAEIKLALQHMILSHHGTPEFGSTVAPSFSEAFLLHEIDMIDSHLVPFHATEESLKPGEQKPGKGLDCKSVYKLNLNPAEKEEIPVKKATEEFKQEELFVPDIVMAREELPF